MAGQTTSPEPRASVEDAADRRHLHRLIPRLPRRDSDGFMALVSIAGLLVVWHLVSFAAGRTETSNERYVPNVVDVAGAFKTLAYYWKGGLGVEATTDGGQVTVVGAVLGLVSNSLATFARLAIGMSIGFLVAGLTAALVCWSSVARRVLLLPANAARMLPLLAMSPLFGIWFGKSEVGAVLFIAFATFAIIFVVALTSIDAVPRHYHDYARSLGAGRVRAYVTGVLPAALPGLRGGVLLTLGFGWSMVIAAEFIGQDVGLGNIVNRAQTFGRTDTLAVLGVFIVGYAWVSYKLVAKTFDHLVRWAE